jgi:hypothetical protein
VTTWECGYCHAVFDKSKEADHDLADLLYQVEC